MIIAKGENVVVTLKDSRGEGSLTSTSSLGLTQDGATIKIESGNYHSTGNTAFWAGGKNQTGHVIVEGGSITGQEGAVGVGKNSSITVNGGTLTGDDNAVLIGNGTKDAYDNATITVNDGEFIGNIQTGGYTGCGIYMPSSGTVIVNGGKFTVDGVGICARAGDINIAGGEFVSTSNRTGKVGDSRNVVTSNGLYYDGAANYPHLGDAKINITGGTFENTADTTIPGVVVTAPTTPGKMVQVQECIWTRAE